MSSNNTSTTPPSNSSFMQECPLVDAISDVVLCGMPPEEDVETAIPAISWVEFGKTFFQNPKVPSPRTTNTGIPTESQTTNMSTTTTSDYGTTPRVMGSSAAMTAPPPRAETAMPPGTPDNMGATTMHPPSPPTPSPTLSGASGHGTTPRVMNSSTEMTAPPPPDERAMPPGTADSMGAKETPPPSLPTPPTLSGASGHGMTARAMDMSAAMTDSHAPAERVMTSDAVDSMVDTTMPPPPPASPPTLSEASSSAQVPTKESSRAKIARGSEISRTSSADQALSLFYLGIPVFKRNSHHEPESPLKSVTTNDSLSGTEEDSIDALKQQGWCSRRRSIAICLVLIAIVAGCVVAGVTVASKNSGGSESGNSASNINPTDTEDTKEDPVSPNDEGATEQDPGSPNDGPAAQDDLVTSPVPDTSPSLSLQPSGTPTGRPAPTSSPTASAIPTMVPSMSPTESTATIFCAIADVPYESDEERELQEQIAALHRDCEFLIHIGDIFEGGKECTLDRYNTTANILLQSPKPVFIVPGDNEWNDCPDVDAAIENWYTAFSSFEDNWDHSFAVEHPSDRPENFQFVHQDTLFIGLNLVGGEIKDLNGEWIPRLTEQANWTIDLIRSHTGGDLSFPQAKGVVIFGHGYPNGNFEFFFHPMCQFMRDETLNEIPVLYLHGDSHKWLYETNYFGQSSFLRVMLEGGTRDPILKIIADPPKYGSNVERAFKFDRGCDGDCWDDYNPRDIEPDYWSMDCPS